jgi:5-methylcytosine-specific restriction endonuclease McrA
MNDAVLVLNANYEPVNVCNLRRAICLLLTDRAILVLNGRGELQTANAIFPRPSIIRLQHMIQRPRPRPRLTRQEVFRRDNYTCQYCGKRTQELTIDHVIPRHMHGGHIWTNVVAACPSCNHRKGGRTLAECGMRLLGPPREPPASIAYIYGRHISQYAEWEPYLMGW